jgi:hypothetical protein
MDNDSLNPTGPGPEPAKIVLNVGCGYPAKQGRHPSFQGVEWRELRLDIDPSVNPTSFAR